MPDLDIIKDRIRDYMIPGADDYIFDELSETYMNKAGIKDILSGIPIPIKKTELTGLSTLSIAKNMACIIGCDIEFPYRDNYLQYIERTFSRDFSRPLINEGVELAASGDYINACVMFRAAILINPADITDALYCYGRACLDAYTNSEDEEYIGSFKAETLDAFEKLTMYAQDFDMGYYFLGFAYLNLGLYMKSKLTFDTFLKLTDRQEQANEVRGLLVKLVDPCRIEQGYNAIAAGRLQEGMDILSEYEDDERFNSWWPLWYYLGTAYRGLGTDEEAEECFQRVLRLSPSNISAMEELVDIYAKRNDEVNYEKYKNKIAIVKSNAALDKEEARAAAMPGLS